MKKSERFRDHAKQCLDQAQKHENLLDRAHWLGLAEQWELLAEDAELNSDASLGQQPG
jgi:hypothetical protein